MNHRDENTAASAAPPAGRKRFCADEPGLGTSRSWLIAASVQSVLTTALIAALYFARGSQREAFVRYIVLIGLIGTWSLALRAIRARLGELFVHWGRGTAGLLRRASRSGKHWIAIPFGPMQENHMRKSIWKLRVIAAGLTLPFFFMPLMWSAIAVLFSLNIGPQAQAYWAGIALFTMVSAAIVGGYFHWAIMPLRAPVRIHAVQRRDWPERIRRRS